MYDGYVVVVHGDMIFSWGFDLSDEERIEEEEENVYAYLGEQIIAQEDI